MGKGRKAEKLKFGVEAVRMCRRYCDGQKLKAES